jgi:hypothetical protein
MAGSGLLALLDDITTLLDDIATLTKVAAGKTVGVVGDDMAVNAEQVAGVAADRELPVVWAVAKGSLLNKAILVPSALALSGIATFLAAPWLVTVPLMLGGTYLCYEAVEKVIHAHSKHDDKRHQAMVAAAAADTLEGFEKKKIKDAIKTDFILSAEIIMIALGTVAAAPLVTQVAALSAIGVGMTVVVYGIVAGLVRMDDWGVHMAKKTGKTNGDHLIRTVGKKLVTAAPALMKGLTVVGTAAMFLVGGGILMEHGIVHLFPAVEHSLHALPSLLQPVMDFAAKMATGVALGTAAIAGMKAGTQLKKKLFSPRVKKANLESEGEGMAHPLSNTPKPDFAIAGRLTAALTETLSPDTAIPKESAPVLSALKESAPSTAPSQPPKNKR